MAVSLSQFVSVQSVIAPAPATPNNPNNLAFYTTEAPIIPTFNPIYRYTSVDSVATDFGLNSNTYSMASVVFSQTPNLLSGAGSLYVIPLINSISATSATSTTSSMATHLTAFKAVSNGTITVAVSSNNIVLKNLDFTQCLTLQDVANVFNKAGSSYFSVSLNNLNEFVFTDNAVGAGSVVVLLATNPLVGQTDLSVATLLNIATQVEVNGQDATGETIPEAIERVRNSSEYTQQAFGITNLVMGDTQVLDLASYIQGIQSKYPFSFVYAFSSLLDLKPTLGTVDKVRLAGYEYFRCLYYTGNAVDAQLMCAGYISKQLSSKFGDVNTSTAPQLKSIEGLLPDTSINDSVYLQGIAVGADMYVITGGQPVIATSAANQLFGTIYGTITLALELQNALLSVLKTNPKLPATATGVAQISSAVNEVARQASTQGMVSAGVWPSQDFIGSNKGLFLIGILNTGYYQIVKLNPSSNGTEASLQSAFLLSGNIQRIISLNTVSTL